MSAAAEPWCFRRELEFAVPHQIALPELGDEDLQIALHLVADRVIPMGNDGLRLERLYPGGVTRAATLDLPTMRWRSADGGEEGCGVLELATWLRRKTLVGTCCALHVALLALRWRN